MTKPNRNKFEKEPSDYELVKADTHEKHFKSKTKAFKSNLTYKQGKLKKDNSKKKKMLKSSVDSLSFRKDSLSSNSSEKTSDLEKKSQCDLCKLSYSLEKDLIEHLSSLMHHTKMEDRETNPVHKCTLCAVTCKTMSDYRMHIGTDRHQRKLSILKGEEVDESDNYKRKGLKYNPQASTAFPDNVTYNTWHASRGSMAHHNLSASHRYNKMHQSIYNGYQSGNAAARQKRDYNFHLMEGEDKDTEKDLYNRGRRPQQESRGGGFYRIDQRPWRNKEPPVFEQWGSGLYSGSNENHRLSNFYHIHKGHGDYRPSDYNGNSEDFSMDDWDEHSFCQKEKFLAGMEDSYHIRNQTGLNETGSNQSAGHFEFGRSSRPEDSVGRERKRPRYGEDIQEFLPKPSKSAVVSAGENIPARDAPKKTFQNVERNNLSRNPSNLSRDSSKISRDPSDVSKDPNSLSRDPSNLSRDSSKVSRDLSKVSRDPSDVSKDPNSLSRDPSNLSRDPSNLSRDPSNLPIDSSKVSRDLSKVSRDPSDVSKYPSDVSKDPSSLSRDSNSVSRDHSSLSKNPSNFSNDNNSPAISSSPHICSSNTLRMSSIDDASNNVLERAERLCKELREKREASQAEKDLLLQRQDREVLNKKMNDLNKKQQSYLKGHLKDSRKSMLTKNSDSVVSSASTTHSKLKEQSPSLTSSVHSKLKDQSSPLTSTVPKANKLMDEIKHSLTKKSQEKSQTNPNLDVESSNKDFAGYEHLRHGDNSPLAPRPQPKPIVISKDSLQKMVNAPKSRAERLQLAKLLHSREEYKSTPTTTPRTSLQLGGLYDSDECLHDTATIKLEDLSDAVRKQISDLIGGDFVLGTQMEGGPGAMSDADMSYFVLTDENIDKSKKKKKSKVKNGKNSNAETTDGVPKPKRKKGESKTSVPKNTTSSVAVNNHHRTEYIEKETVFKSTSDHTKVNTTRAATHSPSFSCLELNRKSTMLTKFSNAEQDNEKIFVDSHEKVASPNRVISLDSDSDLEIVSPTVGRAVESQIGKLFGEKITISKHSPDNIRRNATSAGTVSQMSICLEQNEKEFANDKRTPSKETKSELTSESVMQKFPTIMNFHRPETDLEQVSSPVTQARSSSLPRGPMSPPLHHPPVRSPPLHQSPVPSNIQQPHPSVRLEERLYSNPNDTLATVPPTLVTSIELLDSSPKPLIGSIPIFKSDSISTEVKDLDNCLSKEAFSGKDQLLNDIGIERPSEESRTGVGATAFQAESTSQAVLELLGLSEREEEIKQEMMNMDLRLTRLHKLLEQAVMQINKCTERRSQLLEESQEISNRRMTLLKETAAVKLKDKTGRHVTGSTEVLYETNPNQSGSKSSIATATTLSSTKNSGESDGILGTTLSRADWLAKFSSFLPPDTAVKRNNVLGSESKDHHSVIPAHTDTLNIGLNQNFRDIEMTNDEDNNCSPRDTNCLVTRSLTSEQDEILGDENMANAPPLGGVTNSLFTGPIMYLGSFRSPEAPMNLKAPVIQLNGSGATTPVFKRADVLVNSYNSGGEGATHASNFEDLVSLPKPVKSHNTQLYGGEDSDTISGASCCSIVSGSSLGEKISFYCRNNTSLSTGLGYGKSSLSTIMSDTCDKILTKFPSGNDSLYEMNNTWSKIIRPCSVPLDRIDSQSAKDIYGSLDTQAIKSAEALHLMERNFEDKVSVCTSGVSSDSGKKKKRRTRQERDISGLRRMRRQHIIFSSSSDEAPKSESAERELKVPTGASPTRSNETVILCEGSDNGTPGKGRSTTTLVSVSELGALTPTKPTAVTIAACDSSTSLGLIDSEGITERIKILKEMKGLDQVFGRPVRSPKVTVLNDSSEDEKDFRPKQTAKSSKPDSVDIEESLILNRFSQSGKEWKSSLNNFDGKTQEAFANTHLGLDKKMSRFPGSYGPVIELQIMDGSLYVAYSSFGVQIFSLLDTSSEAVGHFTSSCLHCMTVVKLEGVTTIVAGLGGKLSFCDTQKQPKELDQVSFDMGTPVKCLLMLGFLVYAGLATGEISVFDTKKMRESDRFICCDHPIHCLAPAQEGLSKLLCVSSQDGTILVVNAATALPLRILTGHTKTSFSLQVNGPLVYSGSGDSCVIIHNLHTGVVDHVIQDNQGLVKTVCYNNGFLFTGGMDRLVRCYDTKSRKLVQVYYGAERGVISKIYVYNNMLITGNITGAVDCVELDVKAKHRCHKGCKLKFGNRSHLFWHLLEDHNITTMT